MLKNFVIECHPEFCRTVQCQQNTTEYQSSLGIGLGKTHAFCTNFKRLGLGLGLDFTYYFRKNLSRAFERNPGVAAAHSLSTYTCSVNYSLHSAFNI